MHDFCNVPQVIDLILPGINDLISRESVGHVSGHDHAQFVRVLSSRRALIKREYYIIVPAEYQRVSDASEALSYAQAELEFFHTF